MQDDLYWQRFGLIAGWASIVTGAVMMGLWLARPEALAERFPFLFSMQFNTALCFVATGAAFLLRLRGRWRLSIILAALAGAFAGMTLAQYALASDLGIDRLFIYRSVAFGPIRAGRMAPNAALCFVLVNAAMLFGARMGLASHARMLLSILAFMVSVSALIGYLLGIVTAHDWLPLVRMAPLSAICFAALSGGLIFIGSERLGYHRASIAATLAAAIYLLLVLLTYVELLREQSAIVDGVSAGGGSAGSRLPVILLLSGVVYACLILFAFRTAQRQKDMAAQLSESQKRLAAIIETAMDGFVTINDRGIIIAVNPACERIFGYPKEEMLGRNIKMLMPPHFQDAHDRYLATYKITGKARVVGNGTEVEGRRKDGTTFPLELSVTKVALDHQVLYSGIVRDISERKRNEREILEANAELEEFSYRTSHDLRSPIASSLGLVSIAKEMAGGGASHEELVSVLARIEVSFAKLDQLIQNIIALARARVHEEAETRIDVADMVLETVEGLRHMDGDERTEIVVDMPAPLIIATKPSRLRIILENLISNAIKYRDPREAHPQVRISASVSRDRLKLCVADNGIGIDPADEPYLFQMFRRFHPQQAPGSGLGLYILKKSAQHLAGTVEFKRRDKGSLFIVTLPARTTP